MCLYLMAGSRCCPRCTWEPNLCKSSTRALLPLDSCQGRAHVVDPSLALHRNLKSVCTEERNVKSVCTVDLGCVAQELVDVLHVDDLPEQERVVAHGVVHDRPRPDAEPCPGVAVVVAVRPGRLSMMRRLAGIGVAPPTHGRLQHSGTAGAHEGDGNLCGEQDPELPPHQRPGMNHGHTAGEPRDNLIEASSPGRHQEGSGLRVRPTIHSLRTMVLLDSRSGWAAKVFVNW